MSKFDSKANSKILFDLSAQGKQLEIGTKNVIYVDGLKVIDKNFQWKPLDFSILKQQLIEDSLQEVRSKYWFNMIRYKSVKCFAPDLIILFHDFLDKEDMLKDKIYYLSKKYNKNTDNTKVS